MPWGVRPPGKQPRVICPTCGLDVVLRQNGSPKVHPARVRWGDCPGSGVPIAPAALARLTIMDGGDRG